MPKDWQRRTATRGFDLFVKPSAIDATTSMQKTWPAQQDLPFVGNFDHHGLWLWNNIYKANAIDATTWPAHENLPFVGNFDHHGLWLCFIDFQSPSQVVNVSLAKKRWLLGWAAHFYALMALLMSNLEHCILFIIQQRQFFKANWMQCRRVKDVADDNLFKSLLILGRGLAVAWDMKAILRAPGLCDSAAESWPPHPDPASPLPGCMGEWGAKEWGGNPPCDPT